MKVRIALVFLAVLVPATVASAASCEALAALKLDHTTITLAQSVAAGMFTPPGGAGRGGRGGASSNLPGFCRVAGTIRPSADSDIKFEVWMPLENWNSRFEGVGNGGLAGSISYPAMSEAVRGGYAAGSTDTGHVTEPAGEARWALGHPEKIIDFGYRAVHEMTVQSKAIVTAFYGDNPRYSYWNGCSEGGNQALGEAQRYPADYNGILAGAPANNFSRLQTAGNWISQAIHADPQTFLSASKLPALASAVLAACDANDGVKDGLLEDPRTCHFDPATLLCKSGDSPDCLTAAQITGLMKVYDGPKNPRTGEPLYPGHMRGGEAGWGTWIAGTDVPPRNAQHGIQLPFFRYFVFDNPDWDWKTLDFDKDIALADRKAGAIVNQVNPDLKPFRDGGGKLLQYHGWNDPAISPLNSVNYFTSVQEKMGNTQDFYRLFMMPGMGHCQGGPGPDQFDKMTILSQWVEAGKAPDQITASHATNGQVDRTRPLCAYPKVAKYKGSGSIDDASNFACALP